MDLLESDPLWAPWAVQKARTVLSGDFTPAFALHVLKDAELAAQAAPASGPRLTLTDAFPRWRHADEDIAAM